MNPFGPPFEKLGGETAGYCPTFTGDSTDWVGSNDGTASGGVTIVRDREKGGLQCWEFDGTGYVDLTTEQDFASDFTIAAWIKGSGSEIFWGSAVASESLQRTASTTIRSAFGTNADFTVPAADSEWHSVVLSRSSGTLRLYYDGEESSTGGIANTDTVHLGRVAGDFSGASFTGSVDDLRAFSRSLNPTEVKELYKRGYQRRYAAEHLNPVLAIHPSEDKFGAVSGSTIAHDLSGNGNNGTLAGAAYVNDSGRGGRKALSLDGVDDYIDCGVLPVSTMSAITIAGFLRSSQSMEANGRFVSIGHSNADDIRIWCPNGTTDIRFTMDDGSTSGEYSSSTDGNLHHYALTHDGTTQKVFIDGTEVNSVAKTFNYAGASGEMFLGALFSNQANNAGGEFDSWQVFDYALSESEIRLLAQSRDAKYIEPEDGLVLRLDTDADENAAINTLDPIDQTLSVSGITLEGGATYVAETEKSGKYAFDLDGLASYVAFPVNTAFSPATTNLFTVSVWAKVPAGAASTEQFIIGKAKPADYEWGIFKANNGSVKFVAWQTSGSACLIYTKVMTVNDDAWHHYAMTIDLDAGILTAYIDGAQVGQDTTPTGVCTAEDSVVEIGRRGDGTRYFDGLVACPKIYNRALYQREIAKQYAMERPGEAKSYNSLSGEGLNNYPAATLSHWRNDENTGTAVADSAPEANDGTLTGAWQAALGSWSQSSTDGSVAITALDFGDTDAFTVAGRVKWDATSGGLFIDGVSQQSDTLIRFTDAAAATTDFTVPSMGTASGHHLAITRGSDNGIRVFLDSTESSTGEVNNANTDGVFDPNSFGNSDTWIDDLLVFHRELNANEISLLDSGPAPIFTGATLPTISPQESTECTVSYPANAFGLDPRWGAGTNGTVTEWLYWYLADDANGTNETLVAVTQDPAGYTPQVGEAGKYLRVGIEPENNGGYDPAEFWYSDYALIAAASGGTPSGSGSVSAIASLTGAGQTTRTGEGDVTAIGSLTGAGSAANGGSGSIAAVASLIGAGSQLANGQGAVDAIASLTGAGSAAMAGSGSVTAIAALTGAGTAPVVGGATGAGTITAIGTLVGSGSTNNVGAGSVTAIASITGAGTAPTLAPAAGSGNVTAIASLTGAGQTTRTGEGDVSAVGSLVGSATAPNGGSGSIAAVASLTGAGQQNVKPLLIYYYDAFLATST